MIKVLVAAAAVLLITLVLISSYLSVDDLSSCDVSPSGSAPCAEADAIIAVSGGNTPTRAQEAIDLYKSGWAPVIIFSGAAKDTSGPSNAAVMRRQAIESGVSPSNILAEEYSRTTKENAKLTRDLLDTHSIDRVILVTSGYHQRRASLEFKAITGGQVQVVNHPTGYDDDWTRLWWLTPRGWWLAGGEMVKIIAFYIGGTT